MLFLMKVIEMMTEFVAAILHVGCGPSIVADQHSPRLRSHRNHRCQLFKSFRLPTSWEF